MILYVNILCVRSKKELNLSQKIFLYENVSIQAAFYPEVSYSFDSYWDYKTRMTTSISSEANDGQSIYGSYMGGMCTKNIRALSQ